MTPPPRFVLASASPARLRLLRSAGLDPSVVVSGVDESLVDGLSARQTCATLARLKAEAVAARLRADAPTDPTLVLGCDSVLEFNGEVHGKPADAAEAIARWHRMRGRTGTLHTGHCLLRLDAHEPDAIAEEVGSTEVRFAAANDDEVIRYVDTGEPVQVAGAFTIDGLGGWFLDGITGDSGNVVGVSLPVLRRLLHQVGVGIPELWAAASLTNG
jgi:septum formation protein